MASLLLFKSLTLSASVVCGSDAFEPLLSCGVPPVPQRDNSEGSVTSGTVAGVRKRPHSQLQAEGNTQHLEALHLKVNADRRFVVLIKDVLTKPRNGIETVTRSKALAEETSSLSKEVTRQPSTAGCYQDKHALYCGDFTAVKGTQEGSIQAPF